MNTAGIMPAVMPAVMSPICQSLFFFSENSTSSRLRDLSFSSQSLRNVENVHPVNLLLGVGLWGFFLLRFCIRDGDLNRAVVLVVVGVVLVGRDLEGDEWGAGSGVLSAKEAWNPCEERLLARVVDLVCAISEEKLAWCKGAWRLRPCYCHYYCGRRFCWWAP